jgi:hypothetical protein
MHYPPTANPIMLRKWRSGDLVHVVAPATSRTAVANQEHTGIIERRFHGMGVRLSYGQYLDEVTSFARAPSLHV